FTRCEILGRDVPVTAIVYTPLAKPPSVFGILKLIVLVSEFAFAALIASRRVHPPGSGVQKPSSVSAVVFTTNVAGGASSLLIVSVVGLAPPMTAPTLVVLSVMLTVSFASYVGSSLTVIVKLLSAVSPAVQVR